MSTYPQTIHATLISVFDLGVLFMGNADTGKSELALALINRGHKLVADDAVDLYLENNLLVGRCPGLLGGYLHNRTLGILDIKRLFGDSAVITCSAVDLVVKLGEDASLSCCDHKLIRQLSTLCLCLSHHIDPAIVVELYAKNYLLQQTGFYAEKEFATKQQQQIEGAIK